MYKGADERMRNASDADESQRLREYSGGAGKEGAFRRHLSLE
eukprot:gene12922-892_t